MYAIRLDGNVNLRTNDALREYARLEYRREDVAWILATTKAAKRARRAVRPFRLLARRAPPSHRPVACKGNPTGSPAEGATPA